MSKKYENLFKRLSKTFPSWVSDNHKAIKNSGFFISDLENLSKSGYLEVDKGIDKGKEKRYYRLSPKGFSYLTEKKSKRLTIIAISVSIIGVVISILLKFL